MNISNTQTLSNLPTTSDMRIQLLSSYIIATLTAILSLLGIIFQSDVYPNEEIYSGPEMKNGPDIILSPIRANGFTFGMRTGSVISDTKKTGCHLEEGVVSLYGKGIESGEVEAKIFDIFPTIFKLLNKEVPQNIDGKSLV